MQIATLNYQLNPKENFHCDSRPVFNIVGKTSKKHQRECLSSGNNGNSSKPLAPVKTHKKDSTSMHIQGNGLHSSKLTDASTCSFYQGSRSRSRLSDINDIPVARSRSVCTKIILIFITKTVFYFVYLN